MGDLPSALAKAGAWLRETQKLSNNGRSRTPGGARRPGLRSPGADRSRCSIRLAWLRTRARAAAPAEQSGADPPALHGDGSPTCRRSPVSIPPSTAVTAPHSRLLRPAAGASTTRAFAATASTASPTNMSPTGCARWRRRSQAGRVIVAHLGSGASMCALSAAAASKAPWASPRSTACRWARGPGQLDPGVVLYLIEQKRMTAAQVQTLLYSECGLKGLSGISNDVRELLASNDPRRALRARLLRLPRRRCSAGQLAAALGGLDAFVFTAGHRRELGPDPRPHRRAACLARRRARSRRQRCAARAAISTTCTAASPSTSYRPTRS